MRKTLCISIVFILASFAGVSTLVWNDGSMAMAQMGHHMADMKMVGSTVEQGMEVTLMTADAETFFLVQGETVKTVEKRQGDTHHMMVMLTDKEKGWFIANTAVWMTIKDAGGKVVFDERLWPMLADRPHYGNNVALPGPGTYTIQVQVGVPQLARHAPYQKRWLKPFKVTFPFTYTQGAQAPMHEMPKTHN